MKIRQLVFAGLFVMLPVICTAGVPDYFPMVDSVDFPDAEFGISRTYTGASLFGYMDGGAELYLEYGFSGAWVNEMQWKGNQYNIEIYRMKSPEAAFGIFSISRFRCKSTPQLAAFTCQTPWQLQLCAGSFYVNISNGRGIPADSNSLEAIGKVITGKIKEPSFILADYFSGISSIDQKNCVLVRGDAGLANGAPDMAEFFSGFSWNTALIMTENDETLVSITFSDKEHVMQFMSKHQWQAENWKEGDVMIAGSVSIKLLNPLHLLIRINK